MGSSCTKAAGGAVALPTKSSQPLELFGEDGARAYGGAAELRAGDAEIQAIVARQQFSIRLGSNKGISDEHLFVLIHPGLAVAAHVVLENFSPDACIFKMKTTHSRMYQVKPVVDMLAPGERREVAVSVTSEEREGIWAEFQRSGAVPDARAGKFMVCAACVDAPFAERFAAAADPAARAALVSDRWRSTRGEDVTTYKAPARFIFAATAEREFHEAQLRSGIGGFMRNVDPIDGAAHPHLQDTAYEVELSSPAPAAPLQIVVAQAFHGIFARLLLRNDDARPFVYKTKTTNPKMYLVRPSQGVVAPGGSAEVSISVQSSCVRSIFDQAAGGEYPDGGKFLVQSIPVDDGTQAAIAGATKEASQLLLREAWAGNREQVRNVKFAASFVDFEAPTSNPLLAMSPDPTRLAPAPAPSPALSPVPTPAPAPSPAPPSPRRPSDATPAADSVEVVIGDGSGGAVQYAGGVLGVRREARDGRNCTIVVENRRRQAIIFKTKTTDPRMYLVRPSVGIIEAGERSEVCVSVAETHAALVRAGGKESAGKFLLQAANAVEGLEERASRQSDRSAALQVLNEGWAALEGNTIQSCKISAAFL